MTIQDFKKIARLLKEVYKEVKKEALDNGVDILSPEYDELIARAREAVLEKMDFTLEEYREIKRKLVSQQKEELGTLLEEAKTILDTVSTIKIPTAEEIEEIVEKIAKERVHEITVTRETIKEIEKPTYITETIIQKEEYDDTKLHEQLEEVNKKFEELPEPIDVEKVKEEVLTEFGKQFEHNINILGMADFRKLAMGLQAQIDEVRTTNNSQLDGTGVANRVAFFSDANTLTTESRLTYDSVNGVLGVHKLAGDATDGLTIEANNGIDIGILGAANTANVTWYGSHNFDTVTASRVAQFSASKTLESSTVTTTELGYLSGVTSAIQTQINAKFTLPSLTSGSVLFSNGTTIVQDNANFFWDDTNNFLQVGGALTGVTSDANALYNGAKTANSFVTLNFQNKSNGATASTDAILYNDAGTNSANYLDIGINSSGYTGSSILNGAGDAYIYNVSEDIIIGTATVGKNVVIFTGGTGGTAASKTRATFTDTGLQMMNGSASAPSVSGTGATTTGFYWAATPSILTAIAGVNRLTHSATTWSLNSSNGGTLDIGGTSQYMDFGGTIVAGAATFQGLRTTGLVWNMQVSRTNSFGLNNANTIGGSTGSLTLTTMTGARSGNVLTGSVGITITTSSAFEAREFNNGSSGTVVVTNNYGFNASQNMTIGATINAAFHSINSANATRWNLYLEGTAQNYLEGSTGIGIVAPTAKLQVVQTGTTTPVQILSSTATNDDPTEVTLQSRVATTNATVTTLGTIASATGYSYLIKSKVIARRTGGAGGAAGDYATYEITASANNEAGTLNIDAVTTTVIWEDQAGWDATIDASGTGIRIRVTGAASNNITWHATTMYYLLST